MNKWVLIFTFISLGIAFLPEWEYERLQAFVPNAGDSHEHIIDEKQFPLSIYEKVMTLCQGDYECSLDLGSEARARADKRRKLQEENQKRQIEESIAPCLEWNNARKAWIANNHGIFGGPREFEIPYELQLQYGRATFPALDNDCVPCNLCGAGEGHPFSGSIEHEYKSVILIKHK